MDDANGKELRVGDCVRFVYAIGDIYPVGTETKITGIYPKEYGKPAVATQQDRDGPLPHIVVISDPTSVAVTITPEESR